MKGNKSRVNIKYVIESLEDYYHWRKSRKTQSDTDHCCYIDLLARLNPCKANNSFTEIFRRVL